MSCYDRVDEKRILCRVIAEDGNDLVDCCRSGMQGEGAQEHAAEKPVAGGEGTTVWKQLNGVALRLLALTDHAVPSYPHPAKVEADGRRAWKVIRLPRGSAWSSGFVFLHYHHLFSLLSFPLSVDLAS